MMKKLLKNKWVLIVLAVIIIALGAVAAVLGMNYHKQQQLPKFHDVTIELGTEVLGIKDFLTTHADPAQAGFITDVTKIDLGAVGSHKVTLCHGKKQETVTLTIRDTTAPQVEFLTRRVEGITYIPVPEDFIVSITDYAKTTVSFKEPFAAPEVYSDLILTVVVSDEHGNAVEQACTVCYTWMRDAVTIEAGTTLTKEHILMDAEKDGELLSQEEIDQINAAGVGTYSVTASSGESTITCTVTVQDTQPPQLQLRDVTIYPGGSVAMNSFIASVTDASGQPELKMNGTYDVNKLGTYTVEITATDKLGLSTVLTAKLYVIADTTPPQISGMTAMSVKKHSTPEWLTGVSAYDGKDGSCVVSVNADSVDLTKAGTYTVYYSAVDLSGNKATAKRTVTVLPDQEDTKALVAQIAQSLPATDPESIRDYVRSKIMYTSSWGGDDPVWYGFTKFQGNCYVHALCLKALFDYYGYTSQLIWVMPQYNPHYWLIINIGGTWYHIDPTPNVLHGRYSLMNNEQRLETLSGRKWDTTLWPVLNPPAPPVEPDTPTDPTDPTEPSENEETTSETQETTP